MTMSAGGRIAEHMSIGVLARTYPRERVREILERMGLQSRRVRDLPAEALVYYVIALGLFMAVSTGEVLRSLSAGIFIAYDVHGPEFAGCSWINPECCKRN